ncbi:hypothetical protein O6H91_13G096400 [Diphasiastrum complanatum]|uniref:Uncharacterized protein n=1 Tax=Diphasiastrum complanatum TaxID=34168 RepID=A0ACC2BXK9_DIPCM|nr:hypothetical protein O6H91_13G096400 [Diphasiastrum complanatum]
MADSMESLEHKLAYFHDATGIQDLALSTQILEAHGWNLDAAISAMVDMRPRDSAAIGPASAPHPDEQQAAAAGSASFSDRLTNSNPKTNFTNSANVDGLPAAPGTSGRTASSSHYAVSAQHEDELLLASEINGHVATNHIYSTLLWKLVTLPFSIIRGSYNIMYSAMGMGMSIAGGAISYSLGALRWSEGRVADGRASLLPLPVGAAEASSFVRNFEREYGDYHPHFQTTTFMDALRRATAEFKLLFVYLHSPEHVDSPAFCERTLCAEAVVQFVNENFVSWGADVRSSEGFQMSNSLRASTFPFCAVVMSSSNQRIALLQQLEGLKSASELLAILQRVVEEQGSILVAARADQEERTLNRRLREEQDVAYRAALQADQEREQRRQEEAERAAREAAEAETKRKEEEAAAAEAANIAAEREAALERRRQEKAISLGLEPEKGPNVTQVVIRFPNGERRERRFHCSATVQSVYDYVDSLGSFDVVKYSLVSNFPRTVYDQEKLSLPLKDAGLHPHASLFVQVEES